MKNKIRVLSAALGAAVIAAPQAANAGVFTCISGSFADCAAATSSLSWSWNGLDFTIFNSGLGYVSEVYFDLSGGMSVVFEGGTGNVLFYPGASPPALPGGNTVGFVSDAGFDSDSGGVTHNGIDSGESATFRVLGATAGSFDSGALEAGVHVRSLIDASASLVTLDTPSTVPEPATLALLGLGLAGLGFSRRRKTN
jgi:PEP-CTERM motif-containing protein